VPRPPPFASAEVGAAARSEAVALGVAVGSAAALALTEGDADAVPPAEAVALGRVAVPPTVPGVEPVPEGLLGEVFGVVGFGVDVDLGLAVVVVGFGVLVVAGAGGAVRGCWPEPKRKPTTVPGAGS
jgi:hypothetical protein